MALVDPDDPISVEPVLGEVCGSADGTFYTYEPAGEISTIYDAVATGTSDYADPTHYLRYHYDTRGQVREINDPDGGTSVMSLDAFGNVASTTNARGQSLLEEEDADRP